ncbi:RpiB/LacA/LacB family sugar-phosphate isomerase [Alphaproteobacteria bacterium]|nr:RpiB/LacA/LacB family sugar-phosphate isomerase [Alphaproteobacteria bacterium]
MKSKINDHFTSFIDLGTNSIDSVDYPDFAHKLTNEVLTNEESLGILICGTGVGMSIAANRSKGIRAGLVNSLEVARLIRQHNDANVLVIPGRFMKTEEAINCVKIFIETQFEAGRHKQRIEKI